MVAGLVGLADEVMFDTPVAKDLIWFSFMMAKSEEDTAHLEMVPAITSQSVVGALQVVPDNPAPVSS